MDLSKLTRLLRGGDAAASSANAGALAALGVGPGTVEETTPTSKRKREEEGAELAAPPPQAGKAKLSELLMRGRRAEALAADPV